MHSSTQISISASCVVAQVWNAEGDWRGSSYNFRTSGAFDREVGFILVRTLFYHFQFSHPPHLYTNYFRFSYFGACYESTDTHSLWFVEYNKLLLNQARVYKI